MSKKVVVGAGRWLLEASSLTHMLSFSSLGSFLTVLSNLTLQTRISFQESSGPRLDNWIINGIITGSTFCC